MEARMTTRAKSLRARRIMPAPKLTAGNDIAVKLAALGCDPIAIMARLAMDESLDPKLRAAMAKDLASLALTHESGRDDGGPPLGEVIAAAWRKPTAQKRAAR
jgi:hypothetical protein